MRQIVGEGNFKGEDKEVGLFRNTFIYCLCAMWSRFSLPKMFMEILPVVGGPRCCLLLQYLIQSCARGEEALA